MWCQHGSRVRIERQHDDTSLASVGANAGASEQRAMPQVDAVEIADRDDCRRALRGAAMSANHFHDGILP